jgi:hypothetical protein
MKYMLLIYGDEAFYPRQTPKEQTETMAAFRIFTEALAKSGALLSSNRLSPVSTATTLRTAAKDIQVIDGPFAETREQLGGYYLIEVPDLDAAIKWARQCPGARLGSVEVRPVMEMSATS